MNLLYPRIKGWPPPVALLTAAAILGTACLVVWGWPSLDSPLKVFVCTLSFVLVVALILRSLRRRTPQLDNALRESHYERFRRLEGLYQALPADVRTRPENRVAAAEFEAQRQRLEGWVDPVTCNFTRNDAPDFVHNLHLAFVQISTPDYLHFSIQSLESDYRQAVGPTAYEAYLAAIMRRQPAAGTHADPAEHERILRAEVTYLVNETRRLQLLKQHAECTRQNLLKAAFRSWWLNVIPLLAVIVAFLFCASWVNRATEANSSLPASENWSVDFATRHLLVPAASSGSPQPTYTSLYKTMMAAALLALVGIAGATGGMMSVIQRVQAGLPDSDPGTDLRELSHSETAVFFAPVTGVIFAIVLSLFFAGGVLSGTLFPNVNDGGTGWFFTLYDGKAMGLWLLWGFLAGFSERLVPDALDNLAKQQSELGAKKTPPAGARSAPAPNLPGLGQPATDGAQNHKNPPSDHRPVLDPHLDALPSDACELTITGKNFDANTRLFLDRQPKVVREASPSSLRVLLDPDDLAGKSRIVVDAENGGAAGGRSNSLIISVDEPGG